MSRSKRLLLSLTAWLDADTYLKHARENGADEVDWIRVIPFIGLHLACLGVLLVGVSWIAVAVCLALFFIRMFAITGFYHRYFSHRTFRTSRPFQFVMAVVGNSSAQRGPLWWAAHHRHHHRHSDEEEDAHSPHTHSFLWSHMLWFMTPRNFETNLKNVPDLAKVPELRWLDRNDWVVPVALAVSLFVLGGVLGAVAPGLNTGAWQMLVWGFFVSTVLLFHCTCFINSLAHLMGGRRFDTKDHSRNSLILSLVTLGEGWHNNHHYYPGSVRQGFYWYEIDITYYGLRVLEKLGLIWKLNPVPERVLAEGRGRAARTLDLPPEARPRRRA